MNHNFIIGPTDTDSLSICKNSGIPFSKEEREKLLAEINEISPEFMEWSDDGYYSHCIAIRAKNYVLKDENGKVTIKGSALKASTKSPRMKQFIKDVINSILEDNLDIEPIYIKYCKEAMNITDIKPWSKRITVTKNVLTGTRKNETNVADALIGSELVEGDRCTMFYREDGTLALSENFNGNYSKDKLLLNCFDTIKVFSTILPIKNFKNYKLKKNKKLLELL